MCHLNLMKRYEQRDFSVLYTDLQLSVNSKCCVRETIEPVEVNFTESVESVDCVNFKDSVKRCLSVINDDNYLSCTKSIEVSVFCSDLIYDIMKYEKFCEFEYPYILSDVYRPVDCDAFVQDVVDKSQLDPSLKSELFNVL